MAERQVEMAQTQMTHRHGLEAHVVRSNITREATGQWLAFAIAVLGLGAAVFLAYTGREIGGAGVFLAAVAGLLGAGYLGRQRQDREIRDRRQGSRHDNRGGDS